METCSWQQRGSMSWAIPSHTSAALLVSHLLYMQAFHILRRCTAGNRVVPQAGLHHPIPHQCCGFHSGSGLWRCFHQEDLRGRFSAASHQLCREVPHCECCCFKLLRQLCAGTSFAVVSSCCCQLLLQSQNNAFGCCSIHAVKSCMMAYQLPLYIRSYDSGLYSLDRKGSHWILGVLTAP